MVRESYCRRLRSKNNFYSFYNDTMQRQKDQGVDMLYPADCFLAESIWSLKLANRILWQTEGEQLWEIQCGGTLGSPLLICYRCLGTKENYILDLEFTVGLTVLRWASVLELQANYRQIIGNFKGFLFMPSFRSAFWPAKVQGLRSCIATWK